MLVGAAAVSMSAGAVKAQDALMDNFEAGTNQNKFMSYWYYYNDAVNLGTSKVISSKPGTGTELLFDPTVSLGADETGGKAAKLDYEMGPTPLSCGGTCTFGQFVGFGTDFTPTKKALDLTGATKITYKAKAAAPTVVVVQVSITSVTSQAGDQQFAVHEVTHNIGTSWKTYEVALSETALKDALKQPSWAKPAVPFNPKEVEKIAWKVSMDAATNPLKGTILIDSVVVRNYTWPNPYACMTCVGLPGAGTGGLLADFESLPKNQNKAGFYWYAYNDAEGRTVSSQADYSEIFGGVTPNALVPTKPDLTIAGAKGNAAGDAAFIEFTLGPTWLQGANTIKPFVGVGTRLSDELNVSHFNASTSTGISFDYKTTGTDIDYIRMEAKDERNLGAGIVHFTLLPGTKGEWKSATIPWTKMQLPDYAEVALIADQTLHTKSLEQIQWTFQGDPKKTGSIAIDNVKMVGMAKVDTSFVGLVAPARNASSHGLSAMASGNALQVAFAFPAGRNIGVAELLDTRGKVVSRENLDLQGGARTFAMPLAGKASGVHFLRLKTVNQSGRVSDAHSRLTLLN
ncbi:MAG: hypothetical protein JWP91_3885 [Fibrobacteres bacterium]|nr:hypothetical protein [Fibrobacterota bacterium]